MVAAVGVGAVVLTWWVGALIVSLYRFTSGCEDAGVACRQADPAAAWVELGIAAAGGAVGALLLVELLQAMDRGVARRGRVVLLATTMALALGGWWLDVRVDR